MPISIIDTNTLNMTWTAHKFLQETKSPVSSVLDLRSLLVSQKEEKIELENGLRQMSIEMQGIRLVFQCLLHNKLFMFLNVLGSWSNFKYLFWFFNCACLPKKQQQIFDIQNSTRPNRWAYLRGISGQWDILLLNLTSIGFTNFFRCLILDLFFFTNADVVTIKDETSKENSWNWYRSN